LENVTLLFGGTDQANLSCKVLNNLTNYDSSLNITIILGPGYTFYEELDILIETHSLTRNIQILKNVTNISEILLNSDFLITSPGTTLFEAFCLGVPALAFFQNKSQQDVFRSFFRTEEYENFNDVSIEKYINTLYKDYDSYKKELDFLSIGVGEDEIINKIIQVLKS
jgi:spore coat polysaccharide biosynthesis predicted glycosyltransferase SpsG